MATTRPVTAQVNVDLRATAASMQKMVEDLTKQLAKVDVGSQLGKNLAKELPEIKKQADLFSGIVSQEALSKQDFAELNKAKAIYDRKVKAQTSALAFGNFSSFKFSDEELQQLREVDKQIEKLQKTRAKIAADTHGSILSSALGNLSNEDLTKANELIEKLKGLEGLQGFSQSKSIGDNRAAIDSAAKDAEKQLAEARRQLRAIGEVGQDGFTIKDMEQLNKREAQIKNSKAYLNYAQQEASAAENYAKAQRVEQDLLRENRTLGNKQDELTLSSRSEEYKKEQAGYDARIAALEAKIAANETRMTSGDLSKKDSIVFAKKQFAENFGAITGLSETKTVGTLAGEISNAIAKMADDNGMLSKNQQQAVTNWMKQKGGINLDATALANVLSGAIDVEAIKAELIRQLGGGKETKRIGKDLYTQFQATQEKMTQYGSKPGSFETQRLEQEKQRQADAEQVKQQNENYQNEIAQLQTQKTQLQSDIASLQQRRNEISTQIEQARADQATFQQAQSDAQQKQHDLIFGDEKYKQLETTAQQNAEKYDALSKQIANLETFHNTIQQLQAGFNSLIETLNKLNSADTQAQLDAATDQRSQIINGLVQRARAPGREMGARHEAENEDYARGAGKINGIFSDQEKANTEAENFKRQMQASMRRWMGAREIVNYIRRGIQTAYRDIQNLDKAMTNIAVVTNFSVSDLWGQINDYMAMAKQYGVTTQGVYEVTQLFYQQGLGTSDVMAATTETLKMARISGMSYADAADGMTVAIRAFKMGMEDASHVTDVYSKVAAITASNSQELIEAMSKTASGAANVGSSFENTTAMIATMVEATRESPENIGSALKSIISRFGEMKKGSAFDEDGELIDVNKVQTALASVGVSLLDAQGQFRDFDDVIFELADVWDTLDSASQRYIATIAAGNRQQSRFIALVSNADRLKEVSAAAENSEDAGLIQYAKTLDSLESKQANLKTSFQQFYMDIFNGDFFKGLIDGLNSFLEGLNKLPKFSSIFNIVSIISGVKMLGTILINLFTSVFGQVRAQWKATMENMGTVAIASSKQTGRQYAEGVAQGTQERTLELEGEGRSPAQTATGQGAEGSTAAAGRKQGITWVNAVGSGAIVAGGLLSAYGSSVAQNDRKGGAVLSSLGTGLSLGGNAMTILSALTALSGGKIALIAAGIAAVVAAISSLIQLIPTLSNQIADAEERTKKAREKAEKSNLKRAETAQEVSTLQSGIEKLKDLKKAQYDSAEAQKEYISANNSLAESFPELISGFDEAGNAIIDVTEAELALAAARQRGAKEATEAAQDELETAKEELNTERLKQRGRWKAVGYDENGTQTGDAAENNTSTFQILALDPSAFQAQISEKKDTADKQTRQGRLLSGINVSQPYNYIVEVQNVPKYIADAVDKAIVPGTEFLQEDAGKWFLDHLGNASEVQFYDDLIAAIKSGAIYPDITEDKVDTIIGQLEAEKSLWEEVYKGQQQVAQKAAGVEAGKKLLVARRISEYITNASVISDNQSVFDNLTNATLIANASYLRANEASIEQQIKNEGKTKDETKDLSIVTQVAGTETALTTLQTVLKQKGAVADFNELTKSVESGKITIQQYQTALNEMLGNESGLADLYLQFYSDEIEKANKNIAEALKNHGISADDTNPQKDIAGRLAAAVPQIYHEAIIQYAKTLSAQAEAGKLTKDAMNNRMEKLRDIWEAANEIGDAVLQGQVQSILGSTDFTSTFGKIEAVNKLEDLGYTLDNGTIASQINAFDTGAENLITAYGELTNTISGSLDTISDNLLNAADGFKLEDVQKIAKKTGLDISKDFTFINDKYYANSETAFARINEASLKNTQRQLRALKDKNQEEINILLNGSGENFQQLTDTYEDAANQWVDDLQKRAEKGLLTETEQGYIDKLKSFEGAGGEIPLAKTIAVYLESLNSSMIAAGEQFIQDKLAEQSATHIDNLVKNISDGLSSITSAVEGTLSALDLHELAQRYGLTGKGAISSIAGTTLGQEDFQTLISALYRNSYDQFGVFGGGEFGKQLWDAIQASDNPLFAGYKDIVAAAEEATAAARNLGDRTGIAAKAAWDYADALNSAASAAMLDENSYEFTFMEQDATKGLTKNFDNFVNQIDTVKNAFSSFKEQQSISYQDFYNLMDFINQSADGKGFENFVKNTSAAQMQYEDFVNAVVAKSKEWGKVDIGTIAAQMGISVDTAMQSMVDGMAEGLRDVATSQIKYLSGLEKMLEALAALENIGDVDLKLGIAIPTDDGQQVELTLANIAQYWADIQNLPDDKKLGIQADIQTAVQGKLENLGNNGLNTFFGSDNWINILFGEDGFTLQDADERMLASQFGAFAEKIGTLTESQSLALAQQMRQDLGQFLEFDDKDGISGYKEGFIKAFGKWLSGADLANIGEATDIEVQAAVNAKVATEVKDVELTDDGRLKSTTGKIDQQIRDQLTAYYAAYGYNVVEITVDSEGIINLQLDHIKTRTFIEEQGGWSVDDSRKDAEKEIQSYYEKPFDFNVDVSGETNVRVNLTNGGFTIDTAGEELASYYDSNSGTWDTAALQAAIEAQLGQKIANLNISGVGASATITFTLAAEANTETTLDSILAAINNINSILQSGLNLTVEDSDAISKIDAIKNKLDELRTAAEKIPITFTDGTTPQSPTTNVGGSNTPQAQSSIKEIEKSLVNTNTQLTAINTSPAMESLSKAAKTTEESVKALDDAVGNIRTKLTESEGEATSSFMGNLAQIITANLQGAATINFSQLFNFDGLDTTIIEGLNGLLQNVANSLNEINSQSIKEIGNDAAVAESKINKVVGGLDAIANTIGKVGPINLEGNTDSLSLLASALSVLNNSSSFTTTFTQKGAEDVAQQADLVKSSIDDIARQVSVRFSSSGAQGVAAQAAAVAAALGKIPRSIVTRFSTTGSLALPTSPINGGVFTGNVFTTGSALVNGQMYGAAVAGKTLVGELGPELAVYDNQYHLLGEKGAEFVDLPSDAIVFNHLQTQGIINGKVDSIRGTQLKSAYNHAGAAYAAGNVGPAMASGGISAALAAVRRAKSVWQGLLNSLSAADLLGEGGGGGGGGGGDKASSLKPYLADLQEWYNLSRQIVDLEKRINVLVAQRNNLSKGFDQGATYLRNLKESQALLEDELNTQRDLYRYQVDELERQAKAINDSTNWISKFYKVGADGVLQYVAGNETNGGKGALEVLQELNDMGNNPERFTIKDQIDWIEKITNGQFERGFTWQAPQDENGNVTGDYTKKYWTDEEYAQEFFSALQEPIDDYDALRDTVQETETKFEELRAEIEKINDEIRDNEIEVAQSIHDAIIDVREKAIDDLEESNKLVQEANQKYADAINDAISREREQYNQNQSIAERETLQRQLSLLRRSGGSVSEIQNLEKTISDKLKDEYFTNQENSLEAIKDANDKQTELMNQQVQIMKDSLDYEKENGVIWTKAYEIMAEGNAFMLDFLNGAGADSFLEKSNLEQEKMLEEWAFKIGLYGENERSGYLQNKYTDAAFTELKNSNWEAGYKDIYNSMDAATRSDWNEDFLKTYNSYLLEHINGQSTVEEIGAARAAANEKASQTFFEHIRQEKKRRDDNARAAEEAKNNQNSGSNIGGSSSSGSSSNSSGAKTSYTWKNTITGETGIASSKKAAQAAINRSYQNVYVGAGANAQAGADYLEKKKKASIAAIKKNTVTTKYAAGGYNTTTGPAWLDGTSENPEYVLNAAQTAGLEQLVKFTMRNPDFVDVLKAHYDSLAGNIASQNYNTSNAQNIQIAEGAIQVNVAKLNDSYDINDISNDIMDRMYAIAAKSSSRSVKRR